jgi:hypothetical protein
MILYYNTHKVCDVIRSNNHIFSDYYSASYSTALFNQYEKFGMNRFNVVYDRTNHLPHFLNITPDLHPMPSKIDGYNKSFFDISEIRAKELLSLGKKINVMWSGGIDSTYILFLLRHFANDPEQIRVYGTYNSIIESGNMFDRRIKHEFDCFIQKPTINEFNYQIDDDSIFVSGMCGNQLFGPTDNFFATGNTAMFHHTLGTPETIYEPYEKHINTELLEFLDPIIKTSPKKIETVNDLRWYCIFNLDWYTAIYEHKTQVPPQVASRVHGFFNSTKFQEWAINTKEPFTKIKGDPNTHRWQMRQVLDEMFGETHYAKNKEKRISSFLATDPTWLFLLDGYKNIYAQPPQN